MTNAAMSVAVPAATKPGTRVNWSPAERSEWLALFEKSGQSVSEFCRANDLPPATLSLWRQSQAGTSAGTKGGEIMEISPAALTSAIGPRATVTIRLPDGTRDRRRRGPGVAGCFGEEFEQRESLIDARHRGAERSG